jgi:hypothetical protein
MHNDADSTCTAEDSDISVDLCDSRKAKSRNNSEQLHEVLSQYESLLDVEKIEQSNNEPRASLGLCRSTSRIKTLKPEDILQKLYASGEPLTAWKIFEQLDRTEMVAILHHQGHSHTSKASKQQLAQMLYELLPAKSPLYGPVATTKVFMMKTSPMMWTPIAGPLLRTLQACIDSPPKIDDNGNSQKCSVSQNLWGKVSRGEIFCSTTFIKDVFCDCLACHL